jgi:hypothetical protein
MRELIHDIEHPVFSPIMRAVFDKVVAPHVIAVLRPEPDARTVGEPKTPSFCLFVGNLQALAPPDPLDPLVVDEPARLTQQRGDLAIAVAAVITGKLDDVGGQPLFVVAPRWRLALRRTMLSERRTCATLGDVKFTSNMLDTEPSARGA